MKLMEMYLGQGYRLYVDNFYTSPILFKDLFEQKTSACGTVRENRRGFPKTMINAMQGKDKRGTIRWIRDGNLLFVKWKDTRDVTMLSTINSACGGETVQRKVKNNATRVFERREIPIPAAVKDYNKQMGGVDLSDQLIHSWSYQVLHKTRKWYKTLFFHFIDIGVVNSLIIYNSIGADIGRVPMTHKQFRKDLVYELIGNDLCPPPEKVQLVCHLPIEIHQEDDKTMKATKGRKNCRLCWNTLQKEVKTPWQCRGCLLPLCIIPGRNCFKLWHEHEQ